MTVSSWFSKLIGAELTLNNLEDVLILQLRDLVSAEEQLLKALPKMADAASDPELKNAFRGHFEETQLQRSRLDEAFELLGRKTEIETCQAMQGLIAEGDQVAELPGDSDVKDAALIAAAQRVEHYEMAGYGCARAFAQRLGHYHIAELLQETLDEERNADKLLSHISESLINNFAH